MKVELYLKFIEAWEWDQKQGGGPICQDCGREIGVTVMVCSVCGTVDKALKNLDDRYSINGFLKDMDTRKLEEVAK